MSPGENVFDTLSLDSDGSVSRSLPLSQFKLAESNKALFCQPWVVSLQISSHEERSKTKFPWRDCEDLFLQWLLFRAAIWKRKIRVSHLSGAIGYSALRAHV